MEIDPKHVQVIGDKKFVKFSGLLDTAHTNGLKTLTVKEMHVDFEKGSAWCWMRAVKVEGDKEMGFDGVGSGTQENCGDFVKKHFVEMAQTRAAGRALRNMLNIDMVAFEELGDTKEVVAPFKK